MEQTISEDFQGAGDLSQEQQRDESPKEFGGDAPKEEGVENEEGQECQGKVPGDPEQHKKEGEIDTASGPSLLFVQQ